MDTVTNLFNALNSGIDILTATSVIAGLLCLGIYLTSQWIKKEGQGRGIYLGVTFFILEMLVAGAFIIVPYYLANKIHTAFKTLQGDTGITHQDLDILLRWTLLFIIIPGIIYWYTKKESGTRGLRTAFSHMLVLAYGWLVGKWIGIVFVALPIFIIIYWITYQTALILLPASDPDDKIERWQKFKILCFYIWGIQYPIWIIPESAGRNTEMSVKGDYFADFGYPGAIWTRAHQVAGISTGIQFVDVKGPGLVFTNAYERPIAVVDLRTQVRSSKINVMLNDGSQIKAIMVVVFAIDRNDWKKQDKEKRHNAWRTDPILLKYTHIDRQIGSYPYSSARVRAALSVTGITAFSSTQPDNTKPAIYWDEWVCNEVEQATREILSQRNMNDIWVPKDDGPGRSALDEISAQIMSTMEPRLKQHGIQLFGARIVRFLLGEDDEVTKQQIETWKTIWKQRKAAKIATGDAEYDKLLKEAKAQTRSIFLQSVIGSLKSINDRDPKIAKQVIALHYLDKLETLLQQHQPSPAGEKVKAQIDTIKQEIAFRKSDETEENDGNEK